MEALKAEIERKRKSHSKIRPETGGKVRLPLLSLSGRPRLSLAPPFLSLTAAPRSPARRLRAEVLQAG
jgi:hypothetical protein